MDIALAIAAFIIGAMLGAAIVWMIALGRRAQALQESAELRARAEQLLSDAQRQTRELDALRASEAAERQKRHEAELALKGHVEQAAARERHFQEQREALAQAEQRLIDVFKSAGAQALAANNEQFMTMAAARFQTLLAQAGGDLEKRQQAIDALVKPVRELLEKHAAAVKEIEGKRESAYARLDEQIRFIAAAHEGLRKETGQLVNALRRPESRGRWGELQLRNTVELAGMTAHCDFDEQVTVWSGDRVQRPDMVVNLPGGGVIVVDAKVALDAYLDAIEPNADRQTLIARHADQVSRHVQQLAQKQYWDRFARTPRLVVLFMPMESALLAALECRPDLHANAMQQSVLIATPTLLVALLRAVAYGWQQEDLAANARQIAEAGAALYDRLAALADHFERIGTNLNRSVDAYNKAIGSLEVSVLTGARRLKQLHATTKDDIEPPPSIELSVREITRAELRPSLTTDQPPATIHEPPSP